MPPRRLSQPRFYDPDEDKVYSSSSNSVVFQQKHRQIESGRPSTPRDTPKVIEADESMQLARAIFKASQLNQTEFSPQNETIPLTPTTIIIDQIQRKQPLQLDQIRALTSCLESCHFTGADGKPTLLTSQEMSTEVRKVDHFLRVCMYALLNSHEEFWENSKNSIKNESFAKLLVTVVNYSKGLVPFLFDTKQNDNQKNIEQLAQQLVNVIEVLNTQSKEDLLDRKTISDYLRSTSEIQIDSDPLKELDQTLEEHLLQQQKAAKLIASESSTLKHQSEDDGEELYFDDLESMINDVNPEFEFLSKSLQEGQVQEIKTEEEVKSEKGSQQIVQDAKDSLIQLVGQIIKDKVSSFNPHDFLASEIFISLSQIIKSKEIEEFYCSKLGKIALAAQVDLQTSPKKDSMLTLSKCLNLANTSYLSTKIDSKTKEAIKQSIALVIASADSFDYFDQLLQNSAITDEFKHSAPSLLFLVECTIQSQKILSHQQKDEPSSLSDLATSISLLQFMQKVKDLIKDEVRKFEQNKPKEGVMTRAQKKKSEGSVIIKAKRSVQPQKKSFLKRGDGNRSRKKPTLSQEIVEIEPQEDTIMINTQEEVVEQVQVEQKEDLPNSIPLLTPDKVFMSSLYSLILICTNLASSSKNSSVKFIIGKATFKKLVNITRTIPSEYQSIMTGLLQSLFCLSKCPVEFEKGEFSEVLFGIIDEIEHRQLEIFILKFTLAHKNTLSTTTTLENFLKASFDKMGSENNIDSIKGLSRGRYLMMLVGVSIASQQIKENLLQQFISKMKKEVEAEEFRNVWFVVQLLCMGPETQQNLKSRYIQNLKQNEPILMSFGNFAITDFNDLTKPSFDILWMQVYSLRQKGIDVDMSVLGMFENGEYADSQDHLDKALYFCMQNKTDAELEKTLTQSVMRDLLGQDDKMLEFYQSVLSLDSMEPLVMNEGPSKIVFILLHKYSFDSFCMKHSFPDQNEPENTVQKMSKCLFSVFDAVTDFKKMKDAFAPEKLVELLKSVQLLICMKHMKQKEESNNNLQTLLKTLTQAIPLLQNNSVKQIITNICQSELMQSNSLQKWICGAEVKEIAELLGVCFNTEFIWTQLSAPAPHKNGISFELNFDQEDKFQKEFKKAENFKGFGQQTEENLAQTNCVSDKVFFILKRFGQSKEEIQQLLQAFVMLEDQLAVYMVTAIRNKEIYKSLQAVFKILLTAETGESESFKNYFFEQLGTMCALEMSNQISETPSLDHVFVENILNLAILAPFKQGSADQPLLKFLQENVISQQFSESRTRLQVLDLFCQLGQNMFSNNTHDSYEKIVQEARMAAILSEAKSPIKEQASSDEEDDEAITGDRPKEGKQAKSTQEMSGFRCDDYKEDDSNFASFQVNPEDECTYYRTGKEFSMQHWYMCYTCGLDGNSGACSVCVRKCHVGHHVAYAKKSSFFCDCAPTGACKIYKPAQQEKPKPDLGSFNFRQPAFLGGPPPPFRPSQQDSIGSMFGDPEARPGGGLFSSSSPFMQVSARHNRRPENANPFSSSAARLSEVQNVFSRIQSRDRDGQDVEEDAMLQAFNSISSGGRGAPRRLNRQFQPSNELFGSSQRNEFRIGLPPVGSNSAQNPFSAFIDAEAKSDNMEQEIDFMEQEMLDAGNSFGEIREYIERLRNRSRDLVLDRARKDEDKSERSQSEDDDDDQDQSNPYGSSSDHSESQKSKQESGRNQPGGASSQDDEEMSLANSYANNSETKWGAMSSAHSETSENDFLRLKKMKRLQQQKQRYMGLQTVLSSVQPMIESVLGDVYEKLDGFKMEEQEADVQMIDSTKHLQIKRLTSSSQQSSVLQQLSAALLPKLDLSATGLSFRRALPSNTFKLNMESGMESRQAKQFVRHNQSMRQCADSNQSGLVCVLEDDTVKIYKASNFKKDNTKVVASDSTTIKFAPISCKWNQGCDDFVAVVGQTSIAVLTVDKDGKIKSELDVNMMLDAYGDQLSILEFEWVAGANTVLAVATQSFIRVYDLANDNFSPKYNISAFSGQITSFAFAKGISPDDHEAVILVSTSNKQVFTQPLQLQQNIEIQSAQNSEVTLTQEIEFSSQEIKLKTKIISMDYLQLSKTLVLSFEDGSITFCTLTSNVKSAVSYELPTLPAKKFHQLDSNGKKFSKFVDLTQSGEKQISMVGIYHKEEAGIGVLIKLFPTKIAITPIWCSPNATGVLSPLCGTCLLKPKPSSKQANIIRLITFYANGQAHIHNYEVSNFNRSYDNVKSLSDSKRFQKINMHELPKKISQMPLNFFEKLDNVYQKEELKRAMSVNGNMASVIRGNRIFEESRAHDPVVNDNTSKQLRLQLKLDSKNCGSVIVGCRVRIDGGTTGPNSKISIKVMNRGPIQMKSRGTFWYDIAFCDAEIVCAYQNAMQISFNTEDPKTAPLRIYCIEVFSKTNESFQLNDKLSRHEKHLSKQAEINKKPAVNANSDETLMQELNQTNRVPLLTWSEKEKILGKNAELILELDILQQILLSNISSEISSDLLSTLDKLAQKLTLVYSILLQKEPTTLLSSIQRTLKVVLTLKKQQADLGDPLNFTTLKDSLQMEIIVKNIVNEEVEDVSQDMRILSHIYQKRFHQFFQLLEQALKKNNASGVDLVEKLTKMYLKGETKEQKQEIADLINIQFAVFSYYLNQKEQSGTAKQQISDIYTKELKNSDSVLKKCIIPIETLLMAKSDDYTSKHVVRCIRRATSQYQEAMRRSLLGDRFVEAPYYSQEQGKTIEMRYLFIDLTPFLVQHFLLNTIPKHQEKADMAFKVTYLSLQAYLLQEKILPCEFLFESIKDFIQQKVTEISFNEANYKYLYACLSFLNLLFLMPNANKPLPTTAATASAHMDPLALNKQRGRPGYGKGRYTSQFAPSLATESIGGLFSYEPKKLQISSKMAGGIFSITNEDLEAQGVQVLPLSTHRALMKYILTECKDAVTLADKMVIWTSSALEKINAAFQAGRCSIRIKIEDSVKAGTEDYLKEANAEGGVALLKPIVNSGTWKWAPVLPKSNELFDLLDRKISASLLAFSQLVISQLISRINAISSPEAPLITTQNIDRLLRSIANISHTAPANALFSQIGSLTLESIAKAAGPANLLPQPIANKRESDAKQFYKNQTLFRENVTELNQIYQKTGGTTSLLPYKLQFHLHELLAETETLAKENPLLWQEFLLQQHRSKSETVSMLINLAHGLGEESTTLCLSLAACAFATSKDKKEKPEGDSDQEKDKMEIDEEPQIDDQLVKVVLADLDKLIDSYLIGTNRKSIRNSAYFLIRGIYQTNIVCQELLQKLMKRLPRVKTQGINSSQFMNLLSCICVKEIKKGRLSAESINKIATGFFGMVKECNLQITSHPNLDLYACLQKVSNQFQRSEYTAKQAYYQQVASAQSAWAPRTLSAPKLSTRNNPFILEMEPCSKCFEAKSAPSRTLRLNEIKSDIKFTDTSYIIRLNSTYRIENFIFNLQDITGVKDIRTVEFYVNNLQGTDLTDMKNNWTMWKKIQKIRVDHDEHPMPYNYKMNVPLAVTATNILIRFETFNLAKPMQKTRYQDPAPANSKDLDKTLSFLPDELQGKLSLAKVSKGAGVKAANESYSEKITCPRCGLQVTNKHGICQCGENALYCFSCRAINHDNHNPFLCKDCGKTRHAKFEFQFQVKDGFATDSIDSEDLKKQAEEQIEANLKKAQDSYSQLMAKRNQIQAQVKKLNEGGESAGSATSQIQSSFQNECIELYKQMMKSLSTIKALKIELDKFSKSAINSEQSHQRNEKLPFIGLAAEIEDETHVSSCFACIKKLLLSCLDCIAWTTIGSKEMKSAFKSLGQVELLYSQNLQMYSEALQASTRTALCALLKKDPEGTNKLFTQIEQDFTRKKEVIPAHMLMQNLTPESRLLIKLIDQAKSEKNVQGDITFWKSLFTSLTEAQSSSAIAEAICQPMLAEVKKQMNAEILNAREAKPDEEPIPEENRAETHPLTHMILEYVKFCSDPSKTDKFCFVQNNADTSPGHMFIMKALLVKSSLSVQQEANQIIKVILLSKNMHEHVTALLLSYLDDALQNDPGASEQYFALLTSLLISKAGSLALPQQRIARERMLGVPAARGSRSVSPMTKPEEAGQIQEQEVTDATARHFEVVFSKIDSELKKLLAQEEERLKIGQEGFMPQLSAGQNLCRIVEIASKMMKGKQKLIQIVQKNIRVVIKSLLKLKKLNLMKNKQVRNCEEQIQGIFDQLHSDRPEDKQNFITECLRLIEAGDCDLKECRYLFEDICKMVNPKKAEIEYYLTLQKARSNEDFIPGRMGNNPYSISSFGGKNMSDVLLKISKEVEIDLEMIEMVVASKLPAGDLPIASVYENVWWPSVYKQKNPDSYEVPPITQEDIPNLPPMICTFRLIGIDGEATEDRIETLADRSEPTTEAEILKKYGLASILSEKLSAVTGVEVILNTLESVTQLNQQNKDLVSNIVQLITLAVKLKQNRVEFIRHTKTIDIIAKKLFQSVGMHSRFDAEKEESLFDMILHILEILISEMAMGEGEQVMEVEEKEGEPLENDSVANVEMFLNLISDACKEMIDNNQKQTSQKIKSMSKVLPHLIQSQDHAALKTLVVVVSQYLQVENIDTNTLKKSSPVDQFMSEFYVERIIEIVQSIPPHKNFIKDAICDQPNIDQLMTYMAQQKQFMEPTVEHKGNSNIILLKILKGLVKTHARSQVLMEKHQLVKSIYQISQQKFHDPKMILACDDIVKTLHADKNGDAGVRQFLDESIQKKKSEQAAKAKAARERQKRLLMSKKSNKFTNMLNMMKEETGPKCVACEDGYLTKPSEILGVYVFSKKQQHLEWSGGGQQSVYPMPGYSTVTHNNYIHFTCHQAAARVDYEQKQRIREWDGAKTRNHLTLCNNLLPVRGGLIGQESFENVVGKYFQIQRSQFGSADSNRVKVLSHDLKSLFKRFACQESFSRDAKGGGPEHNMHLISLMTALIIHCLKTNSTGNIISHGENETEAEKQMIFVQEKRLTEFLQQGVTQRQTFLSKLEEEEKCSEDEEEEEKSDAEDEYDDESKDDLQMIVTSQKSPDESKIDQILYFMSQSLIFSRIKDWKKIKTSFITISLCTVAGIKTGQAKHEEEKEQFKLRVSTSTEQPQTGRARARSLSDVSKLDNISDQLQLLRPLMIMLSLVDCIKRKWDSSVQENTNIQTYIEELDQKYLSHDNLKKVSDDAKELFQVYQGSLLKSESVEAFLSQMELKDQAIEEFGSVEQYVASHF